jgi:exonuclease SbcC
MISRIELTNFMSHEHTVIEPTAGLTVLIGPNNCGKSAIVAALQIVCSNENSTYVMRHGAKECSVKVETDDGHAVEWRRKNSPSYRIDGQKFDRLRGSGLPDELHAVLRLPKVEAGENNDFDVHFGTQKSPIFLLDGPASNAARFFASSSDAIRLVEMQKRHKEKLANAQRERTRLEAESKKVNAALETLEPVVDIEKQLAAARGLYHDLQRLANWIALAEKGEAGLRSQSAAVEKHALQVDALRNLRRPPELVPVELLETLIEAKITAKGRLQMAEGRAEVLELLLEPPTLTPTGSLEALIKTMETEQVRRRMVESQSHALSTLQAPPDLHEVSALDRLLADIFRIARDHERSDVQSRTLSQVSPPPHLADVEPLRRIVERLIAFVDELAARHSMSDWLSSLQEPPRLADETNLAMSLAALERARRHVAHLASVSSSFAGISPPPAVVEWRPLVDLIRRIEEGEKLVSTCESATKSAEFNLSSAADDLRSGVEGRACPICGGALDAERLIARATVGLGVHDHG